MSTIAFHVIEDSIVILRSKGVFKQAKVYQRDGRLYASHGSGFIALSHTGTSVPNISVVAYDYGFKPEPCHMGWLYLPKMSPKKR